LRKCFAQIEYKDFLESGYENIFHEFIGQPAPSGEFFCIGFQFGLRNILLPIWKKIGQ
jgi:hypothetical protein